jgi:hypothetical protein
MTLLYCAMIKPTENRCVWLVDSKYLVGLTASPRRAWGAGGAGLVSFGVARGIGPGRHSTQGRVLCRHCGCE